MVVARMRQVYAAVGVPRYLDPAAAAMLAEARAAWTGLGLAAARIVTRGPDHWLLATWAGTVRNTTLALALRARGFGVLLHDGFLDVAGPAGTDLRAVLQALAIPGGISGTDLIGDSATLLVERFHPDLGDDLLAADVLAGRLDLAALAPLAAALL